MGMLFNSYIIVLYADPQNTAKYLYGNQGLFLYYVLTNKQLLNKCAHKPCIFVCTRVKVRIKRVQNINRNRNIWFKVKEYIDKK